MENKKAFGHALAIFTIFIQYNTTVGHTGIARICLAYSVIKREPNLPRLGSPTSTGGEDVTKR